MTPTGLQMRLAARGLPVHRDSRFFGSSEGRKTLIYGAALAAVVFAILWGQAARQRRAVDAVGSARGLPAVNATVAVTAPPLAFVPAEVRHRLLTVEDLQEEPSLPALRALLDHIATLHAPSATAPGATAPGGAPADAQVVDLHISEALADPAAFRGGWVKTDGVVTTLWTEGLDDPNTVDGARPLYRGILVENPKSTGVMFATTTPPSEFTILRDRVLLRGVFLQNIRFKTRDPKIPYRDVPLLVLDSFEVAHRAKNQFLYASILPVAVTVGAAIVVIFIFFHLRRKARRVAAAGSVGVDGPARGRSPRNQ